MQILIPLLLLGLVWGTTRGAPPLSPDGAAYWQRARVRPYGARLLLPLLLGQRRWAWQLCTWASLGGIVLLLGPLAGTLFVGLAMTRTLLFFPVLTDAPGILLAFAISLVGWPWAIPLALVGGLVNEKTPLFGGLALALMGSPLAGGGLMLMGLIPWGLAYWRIGQPADPKRTPPWMHDPWGASAGTPAKLAQLLDLRSQIFPWGIAAVGLLGVPWVLILCAWAQQLIAQDRARVFQWIAPWVCLSAVGMLEQWGLGVPMIWALCILSMLNPWREVL